MFHWICPECGREIAPTVRECPACDAGAEAAELVLAGVVEASARTLNVEASARIPIVETSAPTAHDDTLALDRNRNGVSANGVTDGDISINSVDRDEPHATDTAVAWRNLGARLEVPQESPSRAPDAPLIPEILDAKAAEVRAIEARVADLLGALARPNDAPEARETRPVESKAIPTKTVESKAVETRSVEKKPVEAKAIESRAVESKVVESQVAGSKAAESKLLPAKFSPLTPPKIAAFRRTAVRALDAAADSKDENSFKTDFRTETGATAKADAGTEASPETKPDASVPATPAASTAANPAVNAAANTNIEPEAAAREPVLPSLVPHAPESLNALLAATGMLDDEPQAEPPDPPLSAKLPLSLRPAGVPPAAPAAPWLPASKTQMLPPEAAHEPGIAGFALAESPFPTGPISARPMKAAALAQPTAITPRSAGVRAPRSARPFPAPAMASLVAYSPLADHPLRAAVPQEDLRRTSTAPRITLPGPMLMRSLTSFQDRALAPIFLEERAFRKRFLSGWLATALVVGTVLGVGFSGLLSVAPHSGAGARPASSAERASSDTSNAAEPANDADKKNPGLGHAAASSPLSKTIEVTGFRIVMDPSRKAEVQYLVVNHSPARFSDATVYVTLHTAGARPGQPPLCRFSFVAPNLGPFEAKEMISAIEKTNRPVNLPDWQALRADIEIGQ